MREAMLVLEASSGYACSFQNMHSIAAWSKLAARPPDCTHKHHNLPCTACRPVSTTRLGATLTQLLLVLRFQGGERWPAPWSLLAWWLLLALLWLWPVLLFMDD